MKKEVWYASVSVCEDMEYISNRTCVSCQGHCKDGSPCNKSTGRCDNGCENHWIGEFCEGEHFISLFFYREYVLISYRDYEIDLKK